MSESEAITPQQSPQSMWAFRPEEDVTAYELARVLEVMEIQVNADTYERLPVGVRRHFISEREGSVYGR